MLNSFNAVKVKGERKRLHCVQCKRVTIHLIEARCRGDWSETDGHMTGGDTFSIVRCGACDGVSYETVSWDSETYDHDEDGEIVAIETSRQYPPPVSAHYNFNTESTPSKLDSILDEMLYALAGSKLTLATIGLRLAVEYIVKDKECEGRTLDLKINDLRAKELIDDDQKDLLHRIRKRGNAGAHEALGMSSKELVIGMSIIEGLLEKLYNAPARHAATMRRAKQLLKDEGGEPEG